ncbi:hypothetical protein RFI_16374, partial [Reticulomyxa filosa]
TTTTTTTSEVTVFNQDPKRYYDAIRFVRDTSLEQFRWMIESNPTKISAKLLQKFDQLLANVNETDPFPHKHRTSVHSTPNPVPPFSDDQVHESADDLDDSSASDVADNIQRLTRRQRHKRRQVKQRLTPRSRSLSNCPVRWKRGRVFVRLESGAERIAIPNLCDNDDFDNSKKIVTDASTNTNNIVSTNGKARVVSYPRMIRTIGELTQIIYEETKKANATHHQTETSSTAAAAAYCRQAKERLISLYEFCLVTHSKHDRANFTAEYKQYEDALDIIESTKLFVKINKRRFYEFLKF